MSPFIVVPRFLPVFSRAQRGFPDRIASARCRSGVLPAEGDRAAGRRQLLWNSTWGFRPGHHQVKMDKDAVPARRPGWGGWGGDLAVLCSFREPRKLSPVEHSRDAQDTFNSDRPYGPAAHTAEQQFLTTPQILRTGHSKRGCRYCGNP